MSTEIRTAPLVPGAELGGFRLERVISRDGVGTVYEATQLGLDRRVALTLVAPDAAPVERVRRVEWPEHPHVVSLYATGICEHGAWVAMQLVRGSSLAELAEAGELTRERALALLEQVGTGLDAVHAAGIVHGAVHAQNVRVDDRGRALLTNVGLGDADATAADDRAALAALIGTYAGDGVPARADPQPRRGAVLRSRIAAAAALGVLGVAALATLVAGSEEEPERAPRLLRGATALGSSLPADRIRSVDCSGRAPSGGSQLCTLVQTRLAGRALAVRRDGAIRRWTVRGARGELALQVLRRRGDGYVAVAQTSYEPVPDTGVHPLPADLPVRAGDLIGVQVTPGAAIGVRPAVRGAATARWSGALFLSALRVQQGSSSGFGHEVLVRVEYVPGARPRRAGALTGRAAARAPAGTRLGARDVEPRGGAVRTVAVTRLRDGIVVDLLDRGRRLARLAVAGADPRGRLLALDTAGRPFLRVRWRNPDGRTTSHDYGVGARSLVPRG